MVLGMAWRTQLAQWFKMPIIYGTNKHDLLICMLFAFVTSLIQGLHNILF
jgi:hypothetical protein